MIPVCVSHEISIKFTQLYRKDCAKHMRASCAIQFQMNLQQTIVSRDVVRYLCEYVFGEYSSADRRGGDYHVPFIDPMFIAAFGTQLFLIRIRLTINAYDRP